MHRISRLNRLIVITTVMFMVGCLHASLAGEKKSNSKQEIPLATKSEEKIAKLTKQAEFYCDFDLNKAESYLAQEITRAVSENDSLSLAYALYYSGTIHQLKGLNSEAYKDYKQAYTIFLMMKDNPGIAKTSDGLGSLFRYYGDFEKSLKYHLRSLKIFEKEKDTTGIISALNNIGIAYRSLNNYPKSYSYYNNAISLATKSKSNLLSTVYNSLGSYYWYRESFESAYYYYQKTLNIEPVTIALKERHCAALNNIGNVYRSMNRPDSALYYYSQSLKESRKYEFINLTAITLKNLGITYAQNGDTKKATDYLQRGISLGKQSDLKQVVRDCYMQLSALYLNQGDYKQALKYHQEYSSIQDSIYKDEQRSKVALLEIDYLIQEKEKDLAILKKNNAEKKLELQKSKSLTTFLVLIISFLSILSIGIYRLFHVNKTAKKNLLFMNEELEKRVKSRTEKLELEIANHKVTATKLLEAKEKAEESDKLKSRFLANISHEIRTPMNAIVGFTELLSHTQFKEEEKDQYIAVIQKNSAYLLSIISDIIEVSQIETNQVKLHLARVELNSIVNELYDTYSQEIPDNKHITLSISIPLEPVTIKTDGMKLKQVMANLIGNAIKFTDQGRIAFGYKITDEKVLSFFVDDTGIGINMEHSKIIFERFRQVENEDSEKRGGSGLGLAISKAYVELLGGTISYTSEVGKGSHFEFNIPLKS